MANWKYWLSDKHGLIRAPGMAVCPEVWREGRWVLGSPYVLDAITGMGEDFWSCGEWARDIDRAAAEAFAGEHGIDLDAPGHGV